MDKQKSKQKARFSKNKKLIIIVVAVLLCAVLVTLIADYKLDILDISLSSQTNTSLLSGRGNIVLPSEFDTKSLLEVHFIDVGQGDAIVIMLPDGKIFVIDSGSGTRPSKATRDSYNNYLATNLCVDQIEYMLITHPHSDHYNLLDNVVEQYKVSYMYFNNFPNASNSYNNFCMQVASMQHTVITEISDGINNLLIIEGQDYKITLFAVGKALSGAKSKENSISIICLLEYGTRKVLFTGDAEKETENWFLDYAQTHDIDIDVDILKVAHHGSDTSSTTAFLEATKPEYAVISCGINNSYNHPSSQTMDSLYHYNIATYRTDKHGNVVLYIDGDGDFGFLPQVDLAVENLKIIDTNDRKLPLVKSKKKLFNFGK